MKSTSTVEVQVTNKWRLDLHDQTQGCDWSTSHGWFGSHRGREHPAVFSSMLLILFEKTFVSFSSNIFQAKACLHTEFFECFFCQCLVMFFPNATIDQYPSIFPKSIESTRKHIYLMNLSHSNSEDLMIFFDRSPGCFWASDWCWLESKCGGSWRLRSRRGARPKNSHPGYLIPMDQRFDSRQYWQCFCGFF